MDIAGMSRSARKRAARRDAIFSLMGPHWHREGERPYQRRHEYFSDPALWLYPLRFADARQRLAEYGVRGATTEEVDLAYAAARCKYGLPPAKSIGADSEKVRPGA